MITDQTYREMAKEQYHCDGEIEIDGDAPVSRTRESKDEDGAYVQAWVWVSRHIVNDDDLRDAMKFIDERMGKRSK